MATKSTSDIMFDLTNTTDRDLIEDIVNAMYIVDYGIVAAVNSDDTIDVKHASKLTKINGDTVDPYTLTPSVEVLTLSCSELSIKVPISVGDRVLLLGLKTNLPTVDVSEPSVPTEFYHYSQETLKALPLCLHLSSAKVIFDISDGKLAIKNTTKSLKTILDAFIDAVSTGWTSINCVVGSPVIPNPATLATLAQIKVDLALLLKE
jgi:hypothetical protein